jgi:hypothetical protein
MKIESGILSAYTPGQQRVNNDNSLQIGTGSGASSARKIPTVEPSGPMPSGLANALWLANAKLEKAQARSDSLAAEFMELSKMTPAERLRKELLEALGLTEESLKRLPEEERSAIEEEIRRAMKERLGIEEIEHAGAAEGQAAAGTQEAEA